MIPCTIDSDAPRHYGAGEVLLTWDVCMCHNRQESPILDSRLKPDISPGNFMGGLGYRPWTMSVSNIDKDSAACIAASIKVVPPLGEAVVGARIALALHSGDNAVYFPQMGRIGSSLYDCTVVDVKRLDIWQNCCSLIRIGNRVTWITQASERARR